MANVKLTAWLGLHRSPPATFPIVPKALGSGANGWCPLQRRPLSFGPLQPVRTGLVIAPGEGVRENSKYPAGLVDTKGECEGLRLKAERGRRVKHL